MAWPHGAVLAAVLGVLVGAIAWRLSTPRRRACSAPGKAPAAPPGLPLLGHAVTLSRPSCCTALAALAARHGPALLLGRGPLQRPVVVLSDPDAVHQLLQLDEQRAVKSRGYYASLDKVLHPTAPASAPPSCLASCALQQQWRQLRRALLYSFSEEELRLDLEVVVAKSLALSGVVAGLGPGVVLDVADAARRVSLDVLGLSKLGYDFRAVEATGEVLVLRLLGEVAAEWDAARRRPALLGRLLPYVSDAAAEGQMRARILHDFVQQELWADIEARGPPPPEEISFAAQLYRLSQQAPTRPVASEVAGLLLLGHEPVAAAAAWALAQLAAHPLAQDKLLAELRREGVYDNPAALTYGKLPQLPYLDCVVREALRLFPPMGCPATVRQLQQDVSLGGWSLPAGSEVWVDAYSMQRSPELWRDPERFNPERWSAVAAAGAAAAAAAAQGPSGGAGQAGAGAGGGVGAGAAGRKVYDGMCTVEALPVEEVAGEGENAGEDAGGGAGSSGAGGSGAGGGGGGGGGDGAPLCSPQAFMPFGEGARSCLGQKLAVVEIKGMLAVLVALHKFELSGEEGDVPGVEQGLFLSPGAKGVHLMVHPRKRPTEAA